MTWSYDPSRIGVDPVQQVRFLIQDIAPLPNTPAGLLQNEEIQFLLDTEANIWMAAARALEAASTTAQGLQARSTSAVHVSYFQPSQVHIRANYLRQRGMSHQRISAGGISQADKLVLELNDDWLQPPFKLGGMDNRNATPSNPMLDPTLPIIPGG